MSDQKPDRVVEFNGVEHHFPSDATDAQISAALKAIPASNAPMAPKARTWTDLGGTTLIGLSKAVPLAQEAAEELATNPNIAKTGAAIGRVIGGVAPIVGGAYEGGPIGALAGLAAASKGAWAGGKTGWFSGKLVQELAPSVAKGIEAAAPYVTPALRLAGAAQIANDVAQIAEPGRKDIGFLGVSERRTDAEQRANPALINLAMMKLGQAIDYLMARGMSRGEAVKTVMNEKVKGQ